MQTPSRRVERAALGAIALLLAVAAGAHESADEALPAADGWRLGAAAARQAADASARWPLASRPGVLLQGSAPREQRGRLVLAHAEVSLAARRGRSGAVLAVGLHDRDSAHVETAALSHEGPAFGGQWRAVLGRDTVPFGPVLDGAGASALSGSTSGFGQRPLALHAATDGGWIDDGLRLGWQAAPPLDEATGLELRGLEAGLWRGRAFPGGPAGPAAPTLHLHLGWGHVDLHLGAARLQPQARGAAVALAGNEGHLHGPPDCREGLAQKVCFDGRVALWLASLEWSPEHGAWRDLSLAVGAVRRAEDGLLYASGGEASLRSRLDGLWADLAWRPAVGWALALRIEALRPTHHLAGTGTALLARDAGLAGAARVKRTTLALHRALATRWHLSLEAGRENSAAGPLSHGAVRLVWQAGDLFGGTW
jgi:hypothetical protein